MSEGFDQSSVLPPEHELKALLERRLREKRGVGIVLGVLDADGSTRIVSAGSAGEGARELGNESVFEIGSITKVFTGSLLAEMAGRGELALADPVRLYLPAGVRMPTRNGADITLLDLSTHRSSLPRLPGNFVPADDDDPYADFSAEDMFAFLSTCKLKRDIGSRFEYSNLGAMLLGEALSRAAAAEYEGLIAERILDPLEMQTTGIGSRREGAEWLTIGHSARLKPVPGWNMSSLPGAGALRSNVPDLLRFLKANLGEPSSALERALRFAQEPQLPRPGQRGGAVTGLNWMIDGGPKLTTVWHNGGTGGFSSFIGFCPERSVGVAVLANSACTIDDIGMHLLNPDIPLTGRGLQKVLDAVATAQNWVWQATRTRRSAGRPAPLNAAEYMKKTRCASPTVAGPRARQHANSKGSARPNGSLLRQSG